MSSVSESVGSTPAFLLKLWNLLENRDYKDLISWDSGGKSFHIHDQSRLARDVLPHYFKHNKMSSFIRQLNMYGFRKVAAIDQGALKVENDQVEFAHPYFQRDKPEMLGNIKRRGSETMSLNSQQTQSAHLDRAVKLSQEDMTLVLADVTALRSKQADYSAQIDALKRENGALWGSILDLKRKHEQLRCVLNKLAQFLVSSMQRNPTLGGGMKRKFSSQLMLSDAPASSDEPAAKRPQTDQSLEDQLQDLIYAVQAPMDQALVPAKNGPIIHDVTDQLLSPNVIIKQEGVPKSCQQATSPPAAETLSVQSPPSNGTLPYSPLIDFPTSPVPTPALSPSTTLLGEGLDPNLPLPTTQTPPPSTQFAQPSVLNTPVVPSLNTPVVPSLTKDGEKQEEEQDLLLPSDSNALITPSSVSYKDVRDHVNNLEITVNGWKDLFGNAFGLAPESDYIQSLFNGDTSEMPSTISDQQCSGETARNARQKTNDLNLSFDSNDGSQGNELALLSSGVVPSLLDDLSFPVEEEQTEEGEDIPFNPNMFLQQ